MITTFFFEQISEKAAVLSMIKEPVIPRPLKVPHRLRHGDAEQHYFESEKSMFRAKYFEAIDACLSELNRRFDEESYALLRQIEIAFLNAANQEPIEFSDTLRKTYSNKIDFDQVIAELKLLHSLMKQCLPDVKRATSLDTVISVVNYGQNRLILPKSVVHLIQIYLLAPISAASAERSFSVQRQIKSYLRNTMSEKRYNNLLVLKVARYSNAHKYTLIKQKQRTPNLTFFAQIGLAIMFTTNSRVKHRILHACEMLTPFST